MQVEPARNAERQRDVVVQVSRNSEPQPRFFRLAGWLTRRFRADQKHQDLQPDTRLAELDGIRGLAAVAVVLYHVDARWLPLGWAAVDLFFVLSGFLITRIILKNGNEPGFLKRFYIRRGLRIWPIYYLTLIALMVFSHALPTRCNWSGLWYALTYTQNLPVYWGGKNPIFHPSIRHTWTLAIEEQFYLIWPALLLLVGRRRVIPVALTTLVLTCGFRLAGGSIYLLLGRLDGLALGGLLAGLQMQAPALLTQRLTRSSALVGLLGLFVLQQAGHLDIHAAGVWPGLLVFLVNLTAFGSVGLLVEQAGSRYLSALRLRPLQALGQISYGLYLYHGVLLAIAVASSRVASAGALPGPLLAITLGLCLGLSIVSWLCIERPLLRLKDRWTYPRYGAQGIVPRPHAAAVKPGRAEMRV